MIEVSIGFKNGHTLTFRAESFEVVKHVFGGKEYHWDGLENLDNVTFDADEVLWATAKPVTKKEET